MRHHVGVRLDLASRPARLEALDDVLARREAVEAVQRQRRVELGRGRYAVEEGRVVAQVELARRVEDVDQRQAVALADLEVVEVVRRRDLHRAGALLRIGVVVGDDRDAAADERQDGELADQMLVALVVGMHGHGGVAQHGLGPGGGDR